MNFIKEKIKYIQKFFTCIKILVKEFGLSIYSIDRKKDELDILLLSHSLEKGMGIVNVNKGYGIAKAKKLICILKKLEKTEEENNYVYQEGRMVLKEYIKYQKENNIDISEVDELEKTLKEFEKLPNFDVGYRILDKKDLCVGENNDFDKIVSSKRSIRNFSKDEITRAELEKAINLAVKSPSACNREPWKVYYSLDEEKNQKLSEYVPGNNGFGKDIPYYSVITCDRSYFSAGEMFQWYVNGGIFISYFTLALHSIGIGSCIFQWPDFYKYDKELKKYINISKNEVVIAIVGMGKYPERTKVIGAQRRNINDVLKEI